MEKKSANHLTRTRRIYSQQVIRQNRRSASHDFSPEILKRRESETRVSKSNVVCASGDGSQCRRLEDMPSGSRGLEGIVVDTSTSRSPRNSRVTQLFHLYDPYRGIATTFRHIVFPGRQPRLARPAPSWKSTSSGSEQCIDESMMKKTNEEMMWAQAVFCWKGVEGRSRLPRICSVVGPRAKRLMGMIYGKHSIWDTSSHLCCSSLTIYNDVLV